jgi:hypothetical protein
MSSLDKYQGLPTVIDIGGDLYDLGASQNVDLSHKSRDTFQQTFHPRTYGSLPVEYLLRKYLPVGQKIDKILFTSAQEGEELMDILKRRAQQLRTSQQFSSQVIRNIAIQRYYARILEIMEELRRKKTVKKQAIRSLSENEIFQLILEIAWYLAHPNEVPSEMEKEWKVVIESIQGQRISDIIDIIRQTEQEKRLTSEENPLRYFRKLDMDHVVEANTVGEAMGRVRNMATVVNAAPIRPEMGQRLRNLMNVLHLKQYVDDATPKNRNGIPILDPARLSQSLLSNPMAEMPEQEEKYGQEENQEDTQGKPQEETTKGGAKRRKHKGMKRANGGGIEESMLSIPLGQAMLPIFRYLQMLFDPIYSVLEQATTKSLKRAILPHLLLLLHLCNEFNLPSGKRPEFGLYRIKNLPEALLGFLIKQLEETEQHVAEMASEEERIVFQQQLFHLPRVRLRSLLRNNGGIPTMSNVSQSVFHLQFFVVGQNLTVPDEATFKKKNPNGDSKVLEVMKQEMPDNTVFLAYTDASTTTENIPFRFFDIDYESISVNQMVKAEPLSAELDALVTDGLLKPEDAFLDKLATTKPYLVYNDAELALSVLMGLKERMPK